MGYGLRKANELCSTSITQTKNFLSSNWANWVSKSVRDLFWVTAGIHVFVTLRTCSLDSTSFPSDRGVMSQLFAVEGFALCCINHEAFSWFI